jgi:phospholipid/cholesterol/gamma-HCH transport system substrate-binding protein
VTLVPDERLAQRVGAIALVALAALAALVVLIDGVALGSPTRIRVVFRHSAGLRERAALVVAGQPVGHIEAIVPVGHGEAGALAGEVGAAVIIAIDDGNAWKVSSRAEIFVASRGPLSDKYLEVAPPPGEPGPAIHDGQELRGIDPPSLDNVLQRAWTNMTVYKLFVDSVRPDLDALVAQIGELRRQLDGVARAAGSSGGLAGLVSEARAATAAARDTYASSLGGDAGLAHLRATVGDARAMIGELRAMLDLLSPNAAAIAANAARIRGHLAATDPLARADRTLTAIRAALDKIDPVLATVAELGDRIARGEGSLGRLMSDPEFSDDAKDLGKIMKRHPWRIIARPHD